MTTGIYKITCKETGRCYIGQSKHIEKRWKFHQRKRFLPQFFDYEILVTCQVADLNELEILMIETFDSHANGFNMTIGGTSVKSTHTHAETRAKISAAKKGKLRTPEQRARISAATKAAMERPGMKEKVSETTKAAMAKPEIREKFMEATLAATARKMKAKEEKI